MTSTASAPYFTYSSKTQEEGLLLLLLGKDDDVGEAWTFIPIPPALDTCSCADPPRIFW